MEHVWVWRYLGRQVGGQANYFIVVKKDKWMGAYYIFEPLIYLVAVLLIKQIYF